MDPVKNSNENSLTSSAVGTVDDINAKVEINPTEIVADNPKLVSLDESLNKNENIVLEKPENVSIPSPSEATKLVSLGESGNKNENTVLKNTETEPIPSPSKVDPSQVLVSSPTKAETLEPKKYEKETVLVSVAKSTMFSPSKSAKNLAMKISDIDTAAPFKSVKAAVSKFGGIVDWKAHKVQTVEKHKLLQEELNRANEDIPMYKIQSQSAEEAKMLVLKELEGTKRLIEELILSLERAQTEEQQAKQDAELAILRTEEMEKGIKGDASVAAKAQLEVARARHETAVTELKSVTRELEQLRKDYESLVAEKDLTVKKAEEAQADNLKAEKTMEELTVELISKKDLLELAQADHLEAEEKKVGDTTTQEQDQLNLEKELKEAEEELEGLKREIVSLKDLKSKFDKSSSLLKDLKAELGAYMESTLNENKEKTDEKTHLDILEAVELAKKELLEVRANIEKATHEVNILKMAVTSLTLELEEEKLALKNIKQREGIASVTFSSLKSEVNKIKSEILAAGEREKEIRERLASLRNDLQDASLEADLAKSMAEMAREELSNATEEADLAKAEANTINSRLLATTREIEVAKASEKLALSAINAMRESTETDDTSRGVFLSLEEYYGLSKRVHDAEEKAKTAVSNAISQIGIAKESETKSLKKLEELENEIVSQKAESERAIKKAEDSERGKLGAEQELRKWRASHEERRKTGEIIENHTNVTSESNSQNIPKSLNQRRDSSEYLSDANTEMDTSSEVKTTKKKKKSIFPRLFMFLGRKKAQHAAKST